MLNWRNFMKSSLSLLNYGKLFRLRCCERIICLCIFSFSNIRSMIVCGLSMIQGSGYLAWISILEVVRRESKRMEIEKESEGHREAKNYGK